MVTETRTDPVAPVTLADGETRFYREEGFLLIPGLISESTAAELNDEVMEIMRRIGLATHKLLQSREYLDGSALHLVSGGFRRARLTRSPFPTRRLGSIYRRSGLPVATGL